MWSGIVLLTLLAICVVLLLTFDWNRTRPWINSHVSEATGRLFAIRGNLSLTWRAPPGTQSDWRNWIPWPRLTAQDISVTSWEHLASRYHAQLSEHLTPFSDAGNQYLTTLQAGSLAREESFGVVDRLLNAQSLMMATNEFFFYCAIAFFCLTGLIWLTKPSKIVGPLAAH